MSEDFFAKNWPTREKWLSASNPVAILTDTADEDFDQDVKLSPSLWAQLRLQRARSLQLPLQSAGLSPPCLQPAHWQSNLELNFQRYVAQARKG